MATQNNLQIFGGGFVKAFNEGWQVDVLLKAGDTDKREAIYAHKLVMGARSEVFKQMLGSDKFKANSVGKIEEVTLSELKHEELEAFVGFIYSDGSVLSQSAKEHARSLFVAADKYDIPQLRDLCRQELISSVKASNVVDIFELSMIPFDKSLNYYAARYVIINMSTVCDTSEFEVFVGKHPDIAIALMKSSRTRIWNDTRF